MVCLTTTVNGENLATRENETLVGYNDVIRALAFQYGAGVLDVNAAFHDTLRRAQATNPDLRYTVDGTQLNANGNNLLSVILLDKLHFGLCVVPAQRPIGGAEDLAA